MSQTILIADDDTELCELLREYLGQEGFEVRLAHDGEQALTESRRPGLDAMVLDITPLKKVYVSSKQHGFAVLEARSIVLAMGCRERTRPMIRIPGTRPSGVYTAGTAQRWTNVEGYLPGNRFVILGSGDIGMIMARRLTFEGAKVERVLEVMPHLTGLTRNYVQCLLDFDIQLQLRHTVKRIIGNDRVEAVESVKVDEKWQPVPGTEEIIPCDTLLLSVGLIPENELSKKAGVLLDPRIGGPIVDDSFQTNVPGIFAAGNVVHVYDLVDWVTEAGYVAGNAAGEYAIKERQKETGSITIQAGDNVRYVVPQMLDKAHLTDKPISLQMRVINPIEDPVWVEAHDGSNLVARKAERYVRPGEMVTLKLRPKHFEDVRKAGTLTISVNPK